MSQKIIKIGSSLGLTLPKRVLDKAGLKLSDKIEVEYNNKKNNIEIIPIKNKDQSSSLFLEVKSILEEYNSEFMKLND